MNRKENPTFKVPEKKVLLPERPLPPAIPGYVREFVSDMSPEGQMGAIVRYVKVSKE